MIRPDLHAAGNADAADPLATIHALEQRLTDVEIERDFARQALRRAFLDISDRAEANAALEAKLAAAEAELLRIVARLCEVEQHNTDLVYLQTAAAQLSATFDREAALGAIREIVINLIGCEELAIWGVDEKAGALPLLDSFGLDRETWGSVPLDAGVIGLAAVTGESFVAGRSPNVSAPRGQEASLTACIPLKVGARVVGAIGIFGLLPQKSRLEPIDLELFDLLASQGALALARCLGGKS